MKQIFNCTYPFIPIFPEILGKFIHFPSCSFSSEMLYDFSCVMFTKPKQEGLLILNFFQHIIYIFFWQCATWKDQMIHSSLMLALQVGSVLFLYSASLLHPQILCDCVNRLKNKTKKVKGNCYQFYKQTFLKHWQSGASIGIFQTQFRSELLARW